MIKLKFKIDKCHLAYKLWLHHFFTTRKPVNEEWKKLFEEVKEKYGSYPSYCLFDRKYVGYGLYWANYETGKNFQLIRDDVALRGIFNLIFKSKVFREKYSQCQAYKKKIEAEWKKKSLWLNEFEKITGIQSSKILEVFLLSPELETGSYMGRDQIEWGCLEIGDYKGYQFVGLCHEILHCLTEKQYSLNKNEEDQWLLHAIICLATDEELRIRMYGGNYMDPISPYFSTKKLKGLVQKTLPHWQEYVSSPKKKNILDFFREMKKLVVVT